jgi:hypothetical protein
MTNPTPYKFCEKHMRPSIGPNRCHECFGAQPNPTNEPVHKVNTISPSTKPPENGSIVQQNIAPSALTDPTAQKVVEAAQNYARAIETVKIISEQLKEAKELVAALEKQLKGNQDLADAAQNELRQATSPRALQTVSESTKA